jgi:hypothetical protein
VRDQGRRATKCQVGVAQELLGLTPPGTHVATQHQIEVGIADDEDLGWATHNGIMTGRE